MVNPNEFEFQINQIEKVKKKSEIDKGIKFVSRNDNPYLEMALNG